MSNRDTNTAKTQYHVVRLNEFDLIAYFHVL